MKGLNVKKVQEHMPQEGFDAEKDAGNAQTTDISSE